MIFACEWSKFECVISKKGEKHIKSMGKKDKIPYIPLTNTLIHKLSSTNLLFASTSESDPPLYAFVASYLSACASYTCARPFSPLFLFTFFLSFSFLSFLFLC